MQRLALPSVHLRGVRALGQRRRVGPLAWLTVSVACSLLWPVVASAQAAADVDALVDLGVERRRAGDDVGALELFTRAWEAGHTPRARAQVALAEQALGHFVNAEVHLLEALAATNDEWIMSRRSDLERALEAIQLRLGYLEVRGGIAGADLRVDGRSVGTLPIEHPLRLVTGSYRLEVVARGHYPFARQITIVPDGTTRESVVLARRPGAPGSQGDEGTSRSVDDPGRAPSSRGRAVFGASLLGGGGVMLVTSAVTFGMRQRRASAYNSDACLVGSATRGETCGARYDDTLRAQHASVVTLTLGAALAAAGTLTFVLGRNDTQDSASRPGPVTVACGASFGSTWGGQCRLRF